MKEQVTIVMLMPHAGTLLDLFFVTAMLDTLETE